MLHQVIQNKLRPEVRVLYRMGNIDAEFARIVREHVQVARDRYRSSGDDRLAERLRRFGNKGGYGVAKTRELSRVVFESKKPDYIPMGEALSVEIEMFFLCRDDENNFVTDIRKMGLSKHVTIKNDGSLHWGNEDYICCADDDGNQIEDCGCDKPYGREIVVTFTRDTKDILVKVCDSLNKHSAKINKTCGLHVHFDCRHLEKRNVTALAKRIGLCVPALKTMLPKSRRDNGFCRYDLNGFRGNTNRYAFVNVQSFIKHKTLEIRGHSGTTDSTKMLQWIEILTAIMKKRNTKPIDTIDALLLAIPMSEDLKQYVRMRFLKFNPVTAQTNETTLDDVAADNSNAA